jgi:hypothetical protein
LPDEIDARERLEETTRRKVRAPDAFGNAFGVRALRIGGPAERL